MNIRKIVVAAVLLLAATFASAQTVEYIHTDALGSPVAVTNASGTVIERTVYEPYGAVLNRPLNNRPGYTGHVEDAVTGLNYMQQRYYDPQIGRFLSVDPVTATSAGANFNRYWYANNNPYAYIDADGRESGCVVSTGCKSYGKPLPGMSTIANTADVGALSADAAGHASRPDAKANAFRAGARTLGKASDLTTAVEISVDIAEGKKEEAAKKVAVEAGEKLLVYGASKVNPWTAVGAYLLYNSDAVQDTLNGAVDEVIEGAKEHEAKMQQGAKETIESWSCGDECF